MKLNQSPMPSEGMSKKRQLFVMIIGTALLVCLFSVLIYKLYVLQIQEYADYRIAATEQQVADDEIEATRGSIYDSTGKTLARSTIMWNVICNPSKTSDTIADVAAARIATLLGADKEDIYQRLTKEGKEYWIVAKAVEKPIADEIKEYATQLNEKAGTTVISISLEQTSSREYPYGAFLSTVLGFCGYNDQDEYGGLYGLEKSYNTELAGTNGRSINETDLWGTEISGSNEQQYDAVNGYDLHLTIDNNIQTIVQNYLNQAVERYDVQNRGCAIVMNVNTGEILAMATSNDFDPNNPYVISETGLQEALDTEGELSYEQIDSLKNRLGDDTVGTMLDDAKIGTVDETDENGNNIGSEYNRLQSAMRVAQWKNKTITELYMPGSVFKLITTAAGLDSGKLTMDTSFYCGGKLQVADHEYRCADYDNKLAGHDMENLTMALQNSCNVYYIQAGQTIGKTILYDYFEAFGFTETTGVDLPYETPWMSYYTDEDMGSTELASTSFGQAQSVTPLQMCTAVSAVVNGGYLVTPHVVDYITDENNNIVETVESNVKRQVISEEVSSQIREMMEQVMDVAGVNAKVPGYRIGGKSGTTEQLDKTLRADGDYKKVSSFVAVLPINDPEILVFVMLDDPRGTNDYASRIVAPVVGNIISEVAPYLGLETDAETQVTGNVLVPNCVGEDTTQVQVKLNQNNLGHRIIGSGDTVMAQYPYAGTNAPAGSTVYLYLDTEEMTETTVPDVVGKSASLAAQMLAAANLNVDYQGVTEGTVQSQSMSAGSSVPLGSVVTLEVVDTSTSE